MYILKEIPELDDGNYFLETAKRGWFSIIKPEQKTNLLPNPDMTEINGFYNPTGTGLGLSTLALETNGIEYPSSITVTPTGSTNVISLDNAPFIADGMYTFSAYVRSLTGNDIDITISFGINMNDTYTVGPEYQRIHVTRQLTAGVQGLSVESDGDSPTTTAAPFETTAWQFEEGELTTYISGNKEGDYIWTGTANNSRSMRLESEYAGGTSVSLYELGVNVKEVEGLGSPDFEPIIQDIALSHDDLYLCSIPEQREIAINAVLFACDFETMVCKHGELVKCLVGKQVRMCFHPYIMEGCDTSLATCVCFDFIYTGGLNEPINSFFNQEITIEGISQSPCLNSCTPHEFASVHTDDFCTAVTGGGESVQMIQNDGTHIDANITTLPHALIDVASRNGEIYAAVNIEIAGNTVNRVYRYNQITGTWAQHFELPFVPAGPFDPGSFIRTIELSEEKLYIGGRFPGTTPTTVVGVVTNTPDSLWVYDSIDNEWNATGWDNYSVNSAADIANLGWVRDIVYDPDTRGTSFVGEFETVDGVVSNNYYTIGKQPLGTDYILPTEVGSLGGGANTILPIANDLQYIGGNFINSGVVPGVPSRTIGQSYFGRFSSRGNAIVSFQNPTPFPFLFDGGNYSGGVDKLYEFQGFTFMAGQFDMATSYNNEIITSGVGDFSQHAYLGNLAWFDPTGHNVSHAGAATATGGFNGRILPVSATLPTYIFPDDATTTAYGLFPQTAAYTTTTPATTPLTELVVNNIDEIDGNMVYSARNLLAYGASTNPQPAFGFAEFVFPEGGNPSQGVFITPSLYSDNNNGHYHSVDSPDFLGLYSAGATATGFPQNNTICYNGGVYVEQCSTITDASGEIIIDGDLLEITGVVNVETDKRIIFDPITVQGTATIKYEDQTIKIFTNGTDITTNPIINQGNPLELSGTDRVKVLYNLDLANNATISLKYTPCYISYSEVCACEE